MQFMPTTRRQLLNIATRSLGVWGLTSLWGCDSHPQSGGRSISEGHNTWHALRPAPTKRTEVGAAELNGRLYVAGGYLLSDETVATVEVYDVAQDIWSATAPLPAPRNHLTLASLNGRLFAIGGNDGVGGDAEKPSALAWRLDPTLGKWEAIAPLPAPRAAHAAAVDSKYLYIVGGVGPKPLPTLRYDPRKDRWEACAPIPTERDHLGCAFVAGKVVAVAGRTGGIERTVTEVYDPQKDAWESWAPLPTARHGLVVAGIGNTIYAVGGETFGEQERTYATLEALDTTMATWRSLAPMPTARHGAGGAVYQGRLYVLAGGPQPDLAVTDAAEVYIP